jgi:hypothetical protein
MPKLFPPFIAIVGLGLTAALGVWTAETACSATVVETQPIIVVPQKPIEGNPPSVTPKAPDVHRSNDDLPAPVASMRKRILDAAYSGEMAKLLSVIQANPSPPLFSINEITDPIDYLKTQSGDGNGIEILAIMTDVLEEGWAHVDVGTPQEMYVWPYFAVLPMDKLTPQQLVDVYKIVTSGDFEEMKTSGTYSFYALGIGADGTWHYFKPNN